MRYGVPLLPSPSQVAGIMGILGPAPNPSPASVMRPVATAGASRRAAPANPSFPAPLPVAADDAASSPDAPQSGSTPTFISANSSP